MGDNRLLLRDGRAESALLELFADAGFVVRGGQIMLRRSHDILNFCTQGVSELSKKCEVYASQAFERVKPRRFAAALCGLGFGVLLFLFNVLLTRVNGIRFCDVLFSLLDVLEKGGL